MIPYRAEDFSVTIPVADYIARFRDAERFEGCCRTCPNYGRSWGCPPFDFDVEEYLTRYSRALLIATKIVPEQGGLPIAEAKRLIHPERQRLERRLLEMERRMEDVRSPTSAVASIVPMVPVHVPKGTRAAIPNWCVRRSKPAAST